MGVSLKGPLTNYFVQIRENDNSLNGSIETPQITSYYDTHSWKIGETYRMRVSYIFDLSKFWVVLLEEELNIFQEYIHKFYVANGAQYKIEEKMFHKKMCCVVFTEGSFYRAKIVEIPVFIDGIQRVVVLLIDFGQIISVTINHLYHLHEKFYIPCFAVRACLSQIQPSCDSDRWSSKAIQRFNQLVSEKVLLCLLESTDHENKIINISIAEVDHQLQVHDIRTSLVKERLAVSITTRRKKWKTNRLIPITKNPFLFPSFEAIEQGEVPAEAKYYNLLKQMKASLLLKQTQQNFSLLECYYVCDTSVI